ncbi:MAG TPA: diguanylate cyclase [Pyrinomonadaceae bacterium]|nr:diguanylate cyclase [Pyrinomonadaceae bacterium]
MPRHLLMDNTVPAPERAARQATSADLPTGWVEVQEGLAAASGLALLTVEGRQPPSLAVSNNNSICHAFQSSSTHAHLCQPDCGEAYSRATEANDAVHYRCHAGLQCFAAPVQIGGKKTRAVIGGRCFLRVADYRALAERIRAGDLTDLLSADLFANVIFASRQDLEDLAARVEESARAFAPPRAKVKESEGDAQTSKSQAASASNGPHKIEAQEAADVDAETTEEAPQVTSKVAARGKASKSEPAKEGTGEGAGEESAEVPARAAGKVGESLKTEAQSRSYAQTRAAAGAATGSLDETCRRAVLALTQDYRIESLALLLRADDTFYPTCVTGLFERRAPRVALKPKEIKLLLAATGGDSIAVPAGGRTSSRHEDAVELFPLLVGEEIKGALLVGDAELEDEQRRAVAAFCRDISMPLELLRLREELERRARAASQLRAFTEVVNTAQPDDAYTTILRHSAELLRSERGSLLLFDERAGELSVKAAVGPRADVAREARVRIGEGVSGTVMREGRPAVVRDVSKVAGLRPAPDERRYKTRSFISYPIVVGGRKVGVLNMTDKAGGGDYDEADLGLLDLIAPQMALALDRVEWHSKATQFQLLSITDPLTGLVNRRYLEERLQEELERSKRHRFAMSFMMVDIDDFKNYNDTHGHQAGDLALEMTAQCLKTALRSADVAARYGGEEFSILLPQTSLPEARVIAERIRRRIERTQFPHGKNQPLGAVTVSIGISSFGPEADTPASVIYAADRALYVAKSRGKNCCEAFEPKPPPKEDADEKGKG